MTEIRRSSAIRPNVSISGPSVGAFASWFCIGATSVPLLGGTQRSVGRGADLLSIRPMRVLVLYESRRGFTLTVARALRDELRALGTEATTAPLRTVDAGTLAAADALVVGTWVKGLVIAGVGPANGTREAIDALPELEGRPTVVYCTCEVAPRSTLDQLTDRLDRKGADVRGRVVFKRHRRASRRRPR